MLRKDSIALDKLLNERQDPKEDGLKNSLLWKKKYREKLLDYNYIHTLQDFSLIAKGGFIKPISIYTEELKSGGIIIKIDKEDDKWYALLATFSQYKGISYSKKFWKVYFDNNYIFHKPCDKISICDNKTETMLDWRDKFVSKDELYKYTSEIKDNETLEKLYKNYVKQKK